MAARLLAFASLLVAGAAATGCRTALDCGYNGRCDAASGRCACRAAWSGAACGTLNLLPASRRAGLQTVEADGLNTSSWGGQVLRGADGKWHMLAAEFVNHCGVSAWTRNSRIVHAVSATPGGTYRRTAEVHGVFSHGPALARAPNGSYVAYMIGALYNATAVHGPPCSCMDGSTPPTCKSYAAQTQPLEQQPQRQSLRHGATRVAAPPAPKRQPGHADLQTFMLTAPSLSGPWTAGAFVPLLDCNATFCQHDMTLQGIIHKNGSFSGMCKVYDHHSTIHGVSSRDWSDPLEYVQTPTDESGNLVPTTAAEDPHMYLLRENAYAHKIHQLLLVLVGFVTQ